MDKIYRSQKNRLVTSKYLLVTPYNLYLHILSNITKNDSYEILHYIYL